ncbi:hypothetical protein [Luteolibacter arcticus]|nr:hypothetical protein [Luteolibacter arcticus]
MFRFSVAFAILIVGIGQASAVTAAWKVPVERIAPQFDAAPPLEKPPGDSAFFQPGDKLWDLSGSVSWRIQVESHAGDQGDPFAVPEPGEEQMDWKGDWIVWNSRSGMIVARGSWCDVLLAQKAVGFEDFPDVIRIRVEVKGPGEPRSLSLISRSGEKASLELGELRVEVEPVSSGSPDLIIDSPVRVSWPAAGNHGRWQVVTAISFLDGHRYRIACHGAGDQRWELMASAEREFSDGTARKEARWLETSGGVKPWAVFESREKRMHQQLDANRWLGIYPSGAGLSSHLLARSCLQRRADIKPPAELAEWVSAPLADVRFFMEEQGIVFREEGCFAGIDPLSQKVFIVTDKAGQEMAASSFRTFVDGELEPPIWIETNPESGGWGIASRSGEGAEIKRSGDGNGNNLLFHCETTQAADGVTFDHRYVLDVVSGDTKIGKLESNTTLTKGKPQVIGSGTAPDGKEVKVIVTASGPRE